MRPHDLEALEYPRVLARLADFAQSPAGAASCRALRPQRERAVAAEALEQTWQLFRVLEQDGTRPSTEVPDIAEHLRTAAHEGFVLDGPRLVEVRRVLAAVRELGVFLRRRREQLAALASTIDRLVPIPDLEHVLGRALDDDGIVRDDASDELAGLRASLRHLRAQLERRLDALVHRTALEDVIAEQYVTVRNNRFVVPVKPHYGQKLQGVVQDRSASGETLFIEPLFAVEMNNAILMAVREEERVVRRILADLTALVGRHAPALADAFAALTAVDVLLAKARLAQEYRCTQPRLSDDAVELRAARHPVLLFGERTVVPIDVQLPAGKNVLVITGPNTGGKTVALKTLGLLSLMAQTGLLVPAAEGSAVPCWSGVYADVGDEQNIQRNLSTFSAHIANLVEITRAVAAPALVLLDEPGIGTDPEEGAALAIGLLESLAGEGVRVVATTHYLPVKLHALTHDACVVAAVDFDRATLAPKYRLLYHSLGESLGLPIAERLGIAPAVLETARSAQSEQVQTITAALGAVEASRRAYEERAAALHAREAQLDEREGEVSRLLDELRERRRQKWRVELDEARAFLRNLREEGRQVLAGIEEQRLRRRDLDQFIARTVDAVATAEAQIDERVPSPAGPLQLGDQVETVGGGFRGELVALNGERAWIRRGTMRIEAAAAQLRRVAAAAVAATQPAARMAHGEEAPTEVLLVGLRAKEALAKLDSFLDQAAVAGHPVVRVVHGIGSGALRRAVREYLDISPYCAAYRDGDSGEGGTGVTMVEMGR